jgi:hypothetical protein
MGFDLERNFFRRYGARRMRDYQAQPIMLRAPEMPDLEDDAAGHDSPHEVNLPNVRLDYEIEPARWQTRRVTRCNERGTVSIADLDVWNLRPICFVDGKDVGRSVAWLSVNGYPVPVRVSQIGAISIRNDNGQLKRDWVDVRRVVSFITAYFPDEEIEEFRTDLDRAGFQLLEVPTPDEKYRFDFETVAGRTRVRSRYEMNQLEKQALQSTSNRPTIVDGRLDQHTGAYDPDIAPVLGVVKSHHQLYLQSEEQCCATLYSLEPGMRTPAFLLPDKKIVTWYVRLCGSNGEMPNWGTVRLELPQPFFENSLAGDFSALDSYARLVCEYRCRNEDYGRAPVSLHPIVRAEESLGALFTPVEKLVHHFYHEFRL